MSDDKTFRLNHTNEKGESERYQVKFIVEEDDEDELFYFKAVRQDGEIYDESGPYDLFEEAEEYSKKLMEALDEAKTEINQIRN